TARESSRTSAISTSGTSTSRISSRSRICWAPCNSVAARFSERRGRTATPPVSSRLRRWRELYAAGGAASSLSRPRRLPDRVPPSHHFHAQPRPLRRRQRLTHAHPGKVGHLARRLRARVVGGRHKAVVLFVIARVGRFGRFLGHHGRRGIG